jgi:beta-N-acetylhexosaminidase
LDREPGKGHRSERFEVRKVRGFPALDTRSEWVEQTLASLDLDRKLGQLLHPNIWPTNSPAALAELFGSIEPGGTFLHPGQTDAFRKTSLWLQERSTLPVLVSSDLESGAGHMIEDATAFPSMMSLAAADSERLAHEMGRAAAVEGRDCGVHWSFSPVVDINGNPHARGPNTHGLGDDTDRISRLSTAMIRGMQENGLCATAKHFPDGGFDDRDPHICTTINPLRMDQWFALSGRIYQEAIAQGVWSIMIGHTSLPAWDPGDGQHIQHAPPACLSRRIVSDLLRDRMGFGGVIITDAMNMAGVTAWGPREEIVPASIQAGCDMILFASLKRDFQILKRAVERGRLTEARIDESVRRILALKEALGLPQNQVLRTCTAAEHEHFRQISEQIAARAITVVRDRQAQLPLTLGEGTRVLSYHLRTIPEESQVDAIDDLLRARGVEVTRFDEAQRLGLRGANALAEFDIVLLNAVVKPSWGTNLIRPGGVYMRDVWPLIASHHPRLVFVSYGSPYHLYEMPNLPLMINAYSSDLDTQKAVLRVLTGERQATGQSPVDLDNPYRLASLAGTALNLPTTEW